MDFLSVPISMVEVGPNEDYASLLYLEWAQRASLCYNNLLKVTLTPVIRQHLINLEEVIRHFEVTGPFTLRHIELINQAEQHFYCLIMQPQIYQKLQENVVELNDQTERLEEIINLAEQQWDMGEPELEIKNMIKEKILEVYPDATDSLIVAFSEILFLTAIQGKDVRVNLSPEQLSKLVPQYYTEIDEETCPTCLENLSESQKLIRLPCHNKHVFHPNCILPWLKMSTKCPLCKKDLRELL